MNVSFGLNSSGLLCHDWRLETSDFTSGSQRGYKLS